MEHLLAGETQRILPTDSDPTLAQNSGVTETRSPGEFKKGRLVFKFPTADEEAAIFKPSICVCSGPCGGCGSGCGCDVGSCLAVSDLPVITHIEAR